MPFTTIAYREAAAKTVLDYLTALADQHVTVKDDDITVPELNQILAVQGWGTDPTQIQLSSPSLRRLTLLDVQPFDYGHAARYVEFDTLLDLSRNPIPLDVGEKLNALAVCATDAGVLVFLSDGVPAPVTGPFLTVRATSATAAVGFAWTNVALTLSQSLPAGRYAVVGMRYGATNCIAARLVFVGGGWRPGCVGSRLPWRQVNPVFRHGRWGNWGEFEFDQVPTIDVLCSGASTDHVVYLDLMQVRAGRA